MRDESFDEALELVSRSVRVEHIMTLEGDLTCVPLESSVCDARQLSGKTGYDVIPIRNERGISAYYNGKDDRIQEIKVNNLISWGSSVSNCLPLFYGSEFFFVNRENTIVGFVNYADLDKVPVRLLFYVLLSKLETVLVKVITSTYKNDSWSDLLSPERMGKIIQVFETKKKRGLEVYLVNCLNLSDMLTIVQNSATLLKTLDFESRGECEKICGGLDQLRNDVMHTISPTLLAEGPKKLLERLEKLLELTRRCEGTLSRTFP